MLILFNHELLDIQKITVNNDVDINETWLFQYIEQVNRDAFRTGKYCIKIFYWDHGLST